MEKRRNSLVLCIVGIGLVIGSSTIAVHYKQQAVHLRDELVQTMKRNDDLQAVLDSTRDKWRTAEQIARENRKEVVAEQATQQIVAETESDLQQQVIELQNQLAVARTSAPEPVAVDRAAPAEKLEEPQGWTERGAWLEELKESDPDRYEEIMLEHENRKKQMHQSFADKSDFFLNRDLSAMSPSEQERYNLMVTLLDETWRLAEQMDVGQLPAEERQAIRQQVRQNLRDLNPMLKQERTSEFQNLGISMGYDEKGAKEFAEYVQGVIDVTSMRDVWRGLRSGPNRPRDLDPARNSSRR